MVAIVDESDELDVSPHSHQPYGPIDVLRYWVHASLNCSPPVFTLSTYSRSDRIQEAPDAATVAGAPTGSDALAPDAKPVGDTM